jgi:hypothetical protein
MLPSLDTGGNTNACRNELQEMYDRKFQGDFKTIIDNSIELKLYHRRTKLCCLKEKMNRNRNRNKGEKPRHSLPKKL